MRRCHAPCTVVIATYNRCNRLLETLDRLYRLPERPEIIVVDNGSTDGTVRRLAADRRARVVSLRTNIGAAARNVGVALATSPYVAFCDDDCWWEAGSLERGCVLLDLHAEVALLNASVVVNGSRIDPACALMAQSPVPKRSACPGSSIVAFMAGASIVRRAAFLDAGGYHPRYHIGAEESLLSVDLLERGWELMYVPELLVHHDPVRTGRSPRERRIAVARNRLWTMWLRRSWDAARHATLALARAARRSEEARIALSHAIVGLPWIVRERRPVHPRVESLFDLCTDLPP